MSSEVVFVLTSVVLQCGVALLVAVVLSALWRVRPSPYLGLATASWWFLVAFLGASGLAFRFAMLQTPSLAWNVATFSAEASAVMHAVFLVAAVRALVLRSRPTTRAVWISAAIATGYGALSLWLPQPGPAGAALRQLLRSALPSLLVAGAYVAVMPLLWRRRRPGDHGTALLLSALGANALLLGVHAFVSLASSLGIATVPTAAPWYPASVLTQALFGLGWTGLLLEAEQRTREQAAARAAHADRLLRLALDASVDLIGVVDRDERLVLCNTRMAATIEEVTGQPVTPLMPYPRPGRTGAERARFISTIQRALRGEPVHERAELFSTTGRRMLLDRNIVPIREGDDVTGAFVVARDVTDDEALRLEAERAMRIEAMARMAGGLAHDFNNILTVVQTNLQLLAETGEHDAESMDIMMETAGALDRANQLTRRLLGVARERPAAVSRVDVAALVRDFSAFLQHAIGEEVVLSVDAAGDTACAMIDHGRLEQVLLNLALNARDAMPRGGALRIAVRRQHLGSDGDDVAHAVPAGDYVALEVADDGTGMDDATLAKAGDPFFTTKPSAVGSGLGLATCRAIITEAHGFLELQSKRDEGTTVTLLLPSA